MMKQAIPLSLFARLGFTEILIILLIVFVLFGPKYLPKLTKRVGESLHDWKEVGQETKTRPEDIVQVEPVVVEDARPGEVVVDVECEVVSEQNS